MAVTPGEIFEMASRQIIVKYYIQVFKKCRTKVIVRCSEAFGR
jgi:hypothetical protein